ncbi:MAG TPA: biotin--[acetyl-CoA-carboxylase] ligase [Chloroflexota bacterium]
MPGQALNVDAVRKRTRGLTIGSDMRYQPSVDSTNRLALELPDGDWRTGTVIITDFQEAGRGRTGRSWVAPPESSLLLTVMFRRPTATSSVDYVMLAALAVRDAIQRVTGLTVALKWPNDVLVCSRKVCGILSEHVCERSGDRIVVGIGVNVNLAEHGSEIIPPSATSLDRELGMPVNREELTVALMETLNLWYGVLTHQSDGVYRAWSAALKSVGREVLVAEPAATWTGTAIEARRDGGLIVRTADGLTRTVYAADVSIRDPEDFTTP